MGSISDWLPSRRSELHQMGAVVMDFDGQVRSGKSMVGNARYFVEGSLSMVMVRILGEQPSEKGLPVNRKEEGEATRFSQAVGH